MAPWSTLSYVPRTNSADFPLSPLFPPLLPATHLQRAMELLPDFVSFYSKSEVTSPYQITWFYLNCSKVQLQMIFFRLIVPDSSLILCSNQTELSLFSIYALPLYLCTSYLLCLECLNAKISSKPGFA